MKKLLFLALACKAAVHDFNSDEIFQEKDVVENVDYIGKLMKREKIVLMKLLTWEGIIQRTPLRSDIICSNQ